MDQFDAPTQDTDDKLPGGTENTDTKSRKPPRMPVDYKTLYQDLLRQVNRKDAKAKRRHVNLDIDPSDVDLIQLAHNSYIRELNKYNI